MNARKTSIISIFGEIEEIVARQMMAEGKGVGLLAPTLAVPLDEIPPSTRYNEHGWPVRLVVVMPRYLEIEFEARVADLRI
jgi:hypothetical protein